MTGTGKWIFVVGLAACILSDTCQYLPRLSQFAQHPQASFQTLLNAARRGDHSALTTLADLSVNQQQSEWIAITATLGAGESLYFQYNQSVKATEKQRYLQQAAIAGHGQSQWILAQQQSEPSSYLHWLKRSARNHYPQSIVQLYDYYQSKKDQTQANKWLPKAAHYRHDIALLYAISLWNQAQSENAIYWFNQAKKMGNKRAVQLYDLISQFGSNSISHYADTPVYKAPNGCQMRLQFVADSLLSMERAQFLIDQYTHDTRLSDLPICINQPVWLSAETLECSNHADVRLSCNLSPLIPIAETHTFSHMVVIAQNGKANVHNGIMYLDIKDTYAVFVHELAHFAGFVDEYTLPAELALNVCDKNQAANLRFITHNSTENVSLWQEEIRHAKDYFPSQTETCMQSSYQAYKPVRQTTFMEYHDIELIPPIYLMIWQQQLEQTSRLTPAFVNFAQYYEDKGDKDKAQYWWNKYQAY